MLISCSLVSAADAPEAEISNGVIRAKLYLPDPQKGYYRATRFDWSGVIASLTFQGHEFFGTWFDRYDPKLNDAITGPVEEFRTNEAGLGYDEAKAGETFIRIGVGTVRKPEESAYQTFRTYDIVDNGQWKIRKGSNWIEFTHTLSGDKGYSYVYRKRITATPNKPQIVLTHSLKNTGRRVIETTQYNHNFFVIDKETVGPGMAVKFPFPLKPAGDLKDIAEAHGEEISYKREINKGESVLAELQGFSQSPSDYDFRIENRRAHAAVRIRGDQPLTKLMFWSIRTVACPEPYISLRVQPKHSKTWKVTYDFYETPAQN